MSLLYAFGASFALILLGLAIFGPPLKQYAICVLNLYRQINLCLLRVRGRTINSESEARIVSGKAWSEFCDSLKAAGASMVAPGCPQDAFTQAEGYRYLARLTRVALENFVECSDPAAPRLVALANGFRDAPVKIGSDNPDNLYQSATLTSAIGTVDYLGFGVQAGSYGQAGGLQTVDYKEVSQMTLLAAGKNLEDQGRRIEIFVSTKANRPQAAKKDGSNWLCMREEPEQHMLIVRQTFQLRTEETPAKLVVERLDGQTTPQPLTAKNLDDSLGRCGLFVAGASFMFTTWAKGFQKHANQLPLFDQLRSDKAGGDPNIRYYHSYWKLDSDEALVIEATPPKCHTWNFQLNNHWMESLDYRYFGIHVNKGTAQYRLNDAGEQTVCVVVAHKDPGVPGINWINTVGHSCGTMCWRWVKPVNDQGMMLGGPGQPPVHPPLPRVVKLSEWIESHHHRQEEEGESGDGKPTQASSRRSGLRKTPARAARRVNNKRRPELMN